MNRIAVGGRCLDDTQVTGSQERELKGTGNRCGCQSQCIDTGLHLAQFLLGGHSEFLFFVDDQESEVLKLYCFTDEFMSTDDDINLTVGKIL